MDREDSGWRQRLRVPIEKRSRAAIESAWWRALASARDEMVKSLLAAGLSPNVRFRTSGSYPAEWMRDVQPLHVASANGAMGQIEALLSAGASIDARSRWGGTPLMFAAQCGEVAACERLIAAGADLRCVDGEGRAALTFGIQSSAHPDKIRTLIELLFHPSIANAKERGTGLTALHYAYAYGLSDATDQLVRLGARRQELDASGRLPYEASGTLLPRHRRSVDRFDGLRPGGNGGEAAPE